MNEALRYASAYGATDGVLHRIVMLHRPVDGHNDHILCPECGKDWPCTTFLFVEESTK